ncbi:hypothetical protein CHL78_008935 [Romboutsia weinsteinii]|uniref:Peptidase M56 domain-containing protein n=1 Tax=Romboutsia weinsteinii TaxID=2020949 RepID=A0A371J470_9FIRM|nr:M56 family metallopeptidase [Romboutsia weinsteinii]RDY27580.1 hypothetical protein CHL78_008935 [Romboutsia weinsteinii]
MDELFKLILRTSLYGSITGILILFINIIFKNKLTPKWSYLLWLLLVIKLIIPFGPESNVSIFNKFESENLKTISSYQDKSNNKLLDQSYQNTSDVNSHRLDKSINPQNISIENSRLNDESTFKFNFKNLINNSLSLFWLVIAINIFAFISVSYILLILKLRKYTTRPSLRLDKILDKAKNTFNINRNVKITINEYISTPALIGIFNPKILLPLNMVSMSDNELKHIFLHELSHYKRKDNFINIVLLVIKSIHWFNPFIWYLLKKLREDMELATDEKVLNTLNEEDYINYGATLLTVLSKMNKCKYQPNIISMAKDKIEMEKRIMNIKFIKKYKGKKIIFTTIGALVLGIASPAILTSAQNSSQVTYADIKANKVSNKYEMSKLQTKFFNLIDFMNENKNVLVDEMRSNITEFTLEKTEQQGKDNRCDIYTIGNEQLEVYYVKRDGQGPYYLRAITYKLNGNDIKALKLNYSNEVKEISMLEVATESINGLENSYDNLKLKKSFGDIYSTYIKLIKEAEANNLLTKEDLLKINPNFNQGEVDSIENEISYSIINKEDNTDLYVTFDRDSGNLETIYLYDKIPNSKKYASLFTKTKHYDYKGWDVQDLYNQLYNLKVDETNCLISLEYENPNELKNNFIDFMNK